MSRYFDGRVRRIVGRRSVRLGHVVAIYRLECGHEVASNTNANGGRPTSAICPQCPTWDGHHAGNPREGA